MATRLSDMNGNPFIGVFLKMAGDIVISPSDTSDELKDVLETSMEVKVLRRPLGGTNLHGSLIAANSKGLVLPYFYGEREIHGAFDLLESDRMGDLNYVVSDDAITAWGNNVLSGEDAALVNPDLSKGSIKMLEEILDIEVVKGTIAGMKTVGSLGVLNSKGMIVHPKVTEEEKEALEGLFGCKPMICTANFGSPLLGACMVANDRGAVIGNKSSGVEVNRVEDALDIIE